MWAIFLRGDIARQYHLVGYGDIILTKILFVLYCIVLHCIVLHCIEIVYLENNDCFYSHQKNLPFHHWQLWTLINWNVQPWQTLLFISTEVCACEHEKATLRCELPNDVITIKSALYGRRVSGTTLCPDIHNRHFDTECDDTGTKDTQKVEVLCNNKPSCNVLVSNSVFTPDPCGGNKKYLRVTYTCKGINSMSYSAGA